MAPTKQTDHSTKAKENLLEEFKGLPNWEKILDVFSEQIQDVENVLFELIEKRFLVDAVGEQLDGLGRIVGLPRNGLDDETYRIRLQAQITINAGSGTIDDVITVVLLILGAGFTVTMEESFGEIGDFQGDAAFVMKINELYTGDGVSIAKVLRDVKAVGVRVILEWFNDDGTFQFSINDILTSDALRGFHDPANPSTGGVFSDARVA